jgi:hypothetical protein
MDDNEDQRELSEIPPDEPMDKVRVNFDLPIPDVEQVVGEIARQVLAGNYAAKNDLMKRAREALDDTINRVVAEKVESVILTMLEKPIQPTDAFGNPIGEPTTLQGALARRVTDWASDITDSDGKPTKSDGYNNSLVAPRMNWMLGKIVNGELKRLVDVEVNRIIGELKASATKNIANQIAEKISSLVLK